MAGGIVISADNSWSVSSSLIEFVAERTQAAMSSTCTKCNDQLFADVEPFHLIRLREVDADTFRCFYEATKGAFEEFKLDGTPPSWNDGIYSSFVLSWQDLIKRLEKDPRLSSTE
jgi:hypothetical protein